MEKGIANPQLFGPLLWPAGPHFTHNLYSRLGNVRRVVFMAILPDNCHQLLIAQSEMYRILKFLVLNSAMWLTDTERCEAKPAANQAPIVNHMLQADENWDLGKQNIACTMYIVLITLIQPKITMFIHVSASRRKPSSGLTSGAGRQYVKACPIRNSTGTSPHHNIVNFGPLVAEIG